MLGLELKLIVLRARIAEVTHHAVAAMPANEKYHPVQVDFFCAQTIVQVSNTLPNLIQ